MVVFGWTYPSPLRRRRLSVGRGQDGEGEERGEGPQEGAGEGEGWEFVISATTTTTASSRWRATTTSNTASSRRATTTTTTTRADIFFFDSLLKGEVPPHTGGGRGFLPRCNLWSSSHTPAPGRAGVIFPPCAQLLWCRVVCMKNLTKKKLSIGHFLNTF